MTNEVQCQAARIKSRRVAVIGFGAIASDLVTALLARGEELYRLGVLLDPGSPSRSRVPAQCALLSSYEDLRDFGPQLVVEAAGHAAVQAHVPACLELGLPVVITSVGALHEIALMETLVSLAEEKGGRIILPSGALGGLDYVRAARGAAGLAIRYESRKPAGAWRDELARLGHDPDLIEDEVVLYHGSARGAASAYPSNLNVAATLALAGLGFEETEVSVVVDPKAKGNTHTIVGESELGTIRVEIANRPSPRNPKSSWIVSRSLLAAVEQHFSALVML